MIRYREVQYFHPLLYAGQIAVGVVPGVMGVVQLAEGVPVGDCWLLLLPAATVAVLMALAGRIVLTIDDTRLTIARGWLGAWRIEIELDSVEEAQVCVLQPRRGLPGWRWRVPADCTTCYSTETRRGLRIVAGAKRVFLSSGSPLALKQAILGCREVVEKGRGYLREEPLRRLLRRQYSSGYHGLGLLGPREMERIST